jgi:hypothetical protein
VRGVISSAFEFKPVGWTQSPRVERGGVYEGNLLLQTLGSVMVAGEHAGGDDPDDFESSGGHRQKSLNKLKVLDSGTWGLWGLQSSAVLREQHLYDVVAESMPSRERALRVVRATRGELTAIEQEEEASAQWEAATYKYRADNRVAWRMLVKSLELDPVAYASVLRAAQELESSDESAHRLWELLRSKSQGDTPAGQQNAKTEWARMVNRSMLPQGEHGSQWLDASSTFTETSAAITGAWTTWACIRSNDIDSPVEFYTTILTLLARSFPARTEFATWSELKHR